MTGRVKFDTHSEPSRYLIDREEDELVSFICHCAKTGYAKTRKEVLAIVEEIVASKGNPTHISNGWWESFRHRHPQLTLQTVEKLSYARSVATDATIVNHYFDLLEQTLHDNNLLDSPSQIFNCDETGLPLEHTPSSVVGIVGQKHPRALTSGNKKQITVLGCVNASGYAIPLLVIFARKSLNPLLIVNEVPGTMYGLSDTGWMDSEIFSNWFTHHFLVHAPASRPLLLLLDSHSTHYNPEFVCVAAHEQLIVFCLPPNTTHLTQPLDKGIFGPLKTCWNEECQRYMSKNPGKVVTQYEFMTVFSKAWYQAMIIPNIISAFRTTGVYPFNHNAIDIDDSNAPIGPGSESLAEKTGLAFIPFYTSIHSRTSKSETAAPLTDVMIQMMIQLISLRKSMQGTSGD